MESKEHIEFEEYKEELDVFISQAKEKRSSLINEDNKEDKLTLDDSDTIDVDDIIITHFDSDKEEKIPVKKLPVKKMKEKNSGELLSKNSSIKLALISLLFIPGLFVLFMIGKHSNYLIRAPFFFIIILFLVGLTILFGYSIYCYKNSGSERKRMFKKFVRTLLIGFYTLYIIGCIAFVLLLYGPNKSFKDWFVTTGMSSMNHQYLCKWFYGEKDIKDVQKRNHVVEPKGETDPSKINTKPKDEEPEKEPEYNEYEKQIMIHEKDERYKIITFEVNGATAYLAAIYNPADLSVEITKDLFQTGEYATSMAARTPGAYLGINAGGFIDNGTRQGYGQFPNGIVIVDKQIITNNEYGVTTSEGGIIGLTDDNVLVLLKDKTAEEAIQMGVRDAVSWGPFLIVNGEKAEVYGNGGWGGGARTAIGQRQDGTILFLVVDSDPMRTKGAKMNDLVEIMANYGAYNATNLDGGTSAVMVAPRNVAINTFGRDCHDYFSDTFCYINDPISAEGYHRTRYIATTFVASYIPGSEPEKDTKKDTKK